MHISFFLFFLEASYKERVGKYGYSVLEVGSSLISLNEFKYNNLNITYLTTALGVLDHSGTTYFT